MKRTLIAALIVAGCVGSSPEVQREAAVLAACESFTASLRAANTFETRLSDSQRDAVDRMIGVAHPICTGKLHDEAALVALRDVLREMTLIEQEVSR